jgi:hypothetical protein
VTTTPCIVVGAPVSVEGVLRGAGGLLALRLARPRCVVGLPRAGFITEVAIASAGPDLRPLVDARVKISGDVIAGENDMGGPALVVLAKEVERSLPDAAEP